VRGAPRARPAAALQEDPKYSNWCRYLNHDSAPNVALKTLPRGIGGKPRAWFVTLREIRPGAELCFDYGDDYWHDAAPAVTAPTP
jgi:SET domain-containing protein